MNAARRGSFPNQQFRDEVGAQQEEDAHAERTGVPRQIVERDTFELPSGRMGVDWNGGQMSNEDGEKRKEPQNVQLWTVEASGARLGSLFKKTLLLLHY